VQVRNITITHTPDQRLYGKFFITIHPPPCFFSEDTSVLFIPAFMKYDKIGELLDKDKSIVIVNPDKKFINSIEKIARLVDNKVIFCGDRIPRDFVFHGKPVEVAGILGYLSEELWRMYAEEYVHDMLIFGTPLSEYMGAEDFLNLMRLFGYHLAGLRVLSDSVIDKSNWLIPYRDYHLFKQRICNKEHNYLYAFLIGKYGELYEKFGKAVLWDTYTFYEPIFDYLFNTKTQTSPSTEKLRNTVYRTMRILIEKTLPSIDVVGFDINPVEIPFDSESKTVMTALHYLKIIHPKALDIRENKVIVKALF